MSAYVVLGARVINGKPSRVLESRLEKVMDTAPEGSLIVVSGRDECEAMRSWLQEHVQFPKKEFKLVEENQARSTNENLENVHSLYPALTFTVVTSDFHTFRTKMWVKHLGLGYQVLGASTPFATLLKMLPREALAIVHSALRIFYRQRTQR